MDFQSDYHLLHENKLPTYFYMDFSLVNLFFSSSSSPFYWIAKCILSHFLDYSLAYSILFYAQFCSIHFVFCIFHFGAMNNFVALLNYQMHTLENNHLFVDLYTFFCVCCCVRSIFAFSFYWIFQIKKTNSV